MEQAGRFDGVRRDDKKEKKKSGYRYCCLRALMDVRSCDIGADVESGIFVMKLRIRFRPRFFLSLFSPIKRTAAADTLISK